MTLEERAEEYIEKNCKLWEEGELTIDEIVRLTYKDSAKENSIQWHDLREDPNDLPKDSGIKLCYTRTAKYVCASYDEEYDCWGFVFNNLEHCVPSSVIIAWCEIPTFDKE